MARPTVIVDSSDQSSDGESSSSRASNALVDDEAIDVDDSDAESSSDTIDVPPIEQFHQFINFPVEIRRYIWDMFCPDVAHKHPRVINLEINAIPVSWGLPKTDDDRWGWKPGFALQDQTELVRKLASIHHETREIVTKSFPGVIRLQHNQADLRFDAERDIIFADNGPEEMIHGTSQDPEPGTCDKIRHICFNLGGNPLEAIHNGPTGDMITYLEHMPNLQTIMFGLNPFPEDNQYDFKGWLAEEQTIEARFKTYQKSEGLGEDLEWAFVWPDFKKHPEFLEHQVNPPWLDLLPKDFQEFSLRKSAKIAPMLVFDFDHLWYLDELKERYTKKPWSWQGHVDFSSEYESTEDEDEGPNDYESDGINDDTIEQWDDNDEDEMIPPAVSPPGGAISVSDDSDDDGEGPELPVHSPQAGNFSSPEPETSTNEGYVGPRRPKRRIVSDSDDEDDDEPSAKRTKTASVPISSDEEDDEEVQPRPRGGSRGAPQVILDGDTSSSSSESSSSDDDAPPKQLSLQQRLGSATNLRDNPTPGDDNDDSDDANSFCSYANSDDDDEEEEDSERENDVVDAMAGDTDDDDGDGDGDDGW